MFNIISYKNINGKSEIEEEDNTFLLLNMFMKKTEKTPEIEINRAKRLLKDFIRRNKGNG